MLFFKKFFFYIFYASIIIVKKNVLTKIVEIHFRSTFHRDTKSHFKMKISIFYPNHNLLQTLYINIEGISLNTCLNFKTTDGCSVGIKFDEI